MFSEVYGGEVTRKSSVFSVISGSKRARISKSQMMKILMASFDVKGIAHFEVIPQDKAVN
jgi:hypothetical protein